VTGATPLAGAWRRSGLTVDGVATAERCDVLWLQTDRWYADMRVPIEEAMPGIGGGPETPFARPWAFAGTAIWEEPVMTWNHHLDSEPAPGVDSNRLEPAGQFMVEKGRIEWKGRFVPFTEEWQRISPAGAEMSAEAGENRMVVTIDRWRIEIVDDRPDGPFRAVRYERDVGGEWQLRAYLNRPAPA
jgi:hypothetical protein